MKDRNAQNLFETLGELPEDILNEALETDNALKLHSLGAKKTQKIIVIHPVLKRFVSVCVCLAIIVISLLSVWQYKPQEAPIINEGSSGSVGSEVKGEKFEIDSLDKLNFYSVKKAISEIGFDPLSSKNGEASLVNLTQNMNNSFKNINADTPFTITMYCYFKIYLDDPQGFLAKKLGGTGSVDVVVTKNNFENMITFKKGDNYYSCLQDSGTANAMSFSTYKYIEGFKLVENYSQENYEFTVYFEGDKVTGIKSGRFNSNIGIYDYTVDKIKFVENYNVVVYQTKTVTIGQLEKLFSNEKDILDDTTVSVDGPVVLGEAALTNKTVCLAESQKDVIIKNSDILSVTGKYDDANGYYIELKLTEKGRELLKESVKQSNFISIYVNNFLITDNYIVTTVVNDTAIFTRFSSKDEMLEVYNQLTVVDNKNKIGRIVDNESFLHEMSKLVNFDNYNFSMEMTNYVYDHKNPKKLENKPSNYEVKIDGVNITFPIRVKDLTAQGFEPVRYDFGIGGFKTKQGNEFSVYCMDFKHDAKTKEDYFVTQVDFYADALSGKSGMVNPTLPDFCLFEDINKDITIDEFIKKLGEPHKIYQQTYEDTSIELRQSLVTFYYYFSTPEIPNGYLYVNFRPILNSSSPNNYLFSVGISLH